MILNRTFVFLTLSIILCFSLSKSFGQGCSDAGFCTMGAMKPNQHFAQRMETKLKSVDFTAYAGYTKFHDLITTYIADFNFALGKRYTFQVKLPYTFVNGKLANTNGVGDISLALTRSLIAKEKYQVGITLGTKIPTNNSNFKADGHSLPMYYQSSLGTFDIIAGASLITKEWLFAAGYQEALNKNGNHFKWGDWKGLGETETIARKYPVSDELLRGRDFMLRAERNFRFARFNFFLGLLGIYRVSKDIIKLPATGLRTKVDGSDGLALTALGGLGYRLSARSSIKLLVGRVVVRRKLNPDGLSREGVVSLSYQFRF